MLRSSRTLPGKRVVQPAAARRASSSSNGCAPRLRGVEVAEMVEQQQLVVAQVAQRRHADA